VKAAFLIGPKTVEIRDAVDPITPADGLVLETKACGVCGSDLRRWREGPPAGVSHLVQGHELAGMVTAVGEKVKGYLVGDRLAVAPDVHCGACYYCGRGLFNLCTGLRLLGITPGLDGGFAEKVVLPGQLLQNGIVHRMPKRLSFEAGGLAETLSSVLASHDKCRILPGETVVVMGAGPIGCLHVVVARARGAKVIVSQTSAKRRELAARFEPNAVIDATTQDVVAEVRRLTRGLGADVVICANGVAATQTQGVEMARRGGRVVLFGGLPKADPMVRLDSNLIHYGELTVVGAFSYHPKFHEEALGMLARQEVDAEAFVTCRFPLSRIGEAFETASSGAALKVMVVPDKDFS
jgi:L-iditol 2-dehydrogenase